MSEPPLIILDIDCRQSEARLEEMLAELSPVAQARAARYLSPKARQDLIVTQWTLGRALRALDFDPGEVTLCPNGRPGHSGPVEFNLSHSEGRGVLLLSLDPSVKSALGVDLEWVDRPVERHALARRFFTQSESEFATVSAQNFFKVWTRKEAILKSNGLGLRIELDSFEVLEDEVRQEVSGIPMCLGTRSLSRNYLVSWALPQTYRGKEPVLVSTGESAWEERLREGLDRKE